MNLLLIFILPFVVCNAFAEEGPDSLLYQHGNMDVQIFRSINSLNGSNWGSLLEYSDRSVYPLTIITPPVLFTVSRLNNNYYDENSAVLLLVSTLLNTGVTHGLKHIVKRERPYNVLHGVKLKGKDSHDKYSFPSGHTSTAFNLATTLTLRYPDKPVLVSSLYLYASLIGFGRIYFGAHYPSDVTAGALIGAGSSLLIYSLRKEIINGKNNLLNESGRSDRNDFNGMAGYVTFGSIAVSEILNYIIHSRSNITDKKIQFAPYPAGLSFTFHL